MHVPEICEALRSLRRSPAFTIAIVLTIALGIGATATYNVVYNVLFRPLPFRDPGRLVQLWETTPALPQLQVTVSDYQDWWEQARGFEQISAYTFQAMNRVTMISPGDPEVVQATMVTHDLFSTLGIQPLLGREFTTEDEQGKQNVALISENLWRRKFGGDPAIVGRSLRLETLGLTVIGVVSREQAFPAWAQIWLPFSLLNEEPGFTSGHTLAIEVPSSRDWNKAHEFFDSQLIPAVRALPGVVTVAAANSAPMSLGATEHSRFAVEGMTFPQGQYPVAQTRWVTPDYFYVLQIPLKRGRWLTEADRGKPRLLINEALARQFFRNDPTTKRLVTGVVDPHQTFNEIVGVVGDVREMGLDADVAPTFYSIGTGPIMTLLVKTAIKPEQLLASIQKTIRQTDSQVAVSSAKTLQQFVDESLARRRFTLAILGIFGGLGAFLTAAGVYGVLAYSVNGRRREFGVRMAMGAKPSNITTMILRETTIVAIPGMVSGVILHLVLSRLMTGLIYQVSPTDPAAIIGAGAFLCLVVLLSAWVPAKRASSVDPSESLRIEY